MSRRSDPGNSESVRAAPLRGAVLAVIALVAALHMCSHTASAQTITVDDPNGGETVYVGYDYDIQWSRTGTPASCKVELSRLGTWGDTVELTTINATSYTWPVTGAVTVGATALIRVTNTNEPSATDDSDAGFTIADPFIAVTHPNTALSVDDAESLTITWTAGGPSLVDIDLSRDGVSGPWESIATDVTATTGSYVWAVSGAASTTCIIRVSDAAGFTSSDSSDVEFAIYSGASSLAVTSPDTFVSWNIGEEQSITWTATNVMAVDIELTRNNGTDWETIASGVNATSGTPYLWTPDGLQSDQCRIRVSDADGSPTDQSTELFTLAPTITVTAPDTTVTWDIGTAYNITWVAAGLTNVDIHLTRDNGFSWEPIATGVHATDDTPFSWTPDGLQSTQCRIRVRDTDGSPADSSDQLFTLAPSLTLTAPVGAVTWDIGTAYNITWTSLGLEYVNISISRNGGADWTPIDTNVDGTTGTYSWTVNVLESDDCRVAVFDTDGTPSDQSPVSFSIVPTVEVTAPNLGTAWDIGTEYDIAWSSTGLTNVNISVSRNSGPWELIAGNVDATTSPYPWTVTGPAETNCKIIVSDTDDDPYDESDLAFDIVATVGVTVPNTAVTWDIGTAYDISWVYTGLANVDIQVQRDGGAWDPIATGVDATTSPYSWTVDGPASPNCLIRVSDAAIGGPSDTSDVPFIIAATVEVTAPNTAVTWILGDDYDISWTSTGLSFVDIEISRDGGAWDSIASDVDATSSPYSWTVTAPASVNCLVRVSDASDGAPLDVSDVSFDIVPPPSITLDAPTGGETWTPSTSQNITWTAVTVANVMIELSRDGGTTWATLAPSVDATSGTPYSWTVTPGPSVTCYVRVSDVSDSSVYDQSGSPFTIRGIDLTAPNGGESWLLGETVSIQWTSVSVTNAHIEISRDNGGSWDDIVASTPTASGAYSWVVTGPASGQCLIQASDAAAPTVVDTSAASFEIRDVLPFLGGGCGAPTHPVAGVWLALVACALLARRVRRSRDLA